MQAAQAKQADANPLPTRTLLPLTEKISPQALKESVLILKYQIEERETRIEQLESQISSFDNTAPAKLRDAETEVSWLRELLGVRVDDLEDIITTLSLPSYDREAVKDAAVRLKANLQMEQQEKERALAGGQSFPSLASISNFAASPKSLPLAAAWRNWRHGRDLGFSSHLSAVANEAADQTPSKSSPQSIFAGLMTPPSTKMRATTPIGRSGPASSSSQPPARAPVTLGHSSSHQGITEMSTARQQEPVTPPLMRKSSYDLDASQSTSFGDQGVNGNKTAGEEPFGPRLGGIVGRM